MSKQIPNIPKKYFKFVLLDLYDYVVQTEFRFVCKHCCQDYWGLESTTISVSFSKRKTFKVRFTAGIPDTVTDLSKVFIINEAVYVSGILPINFIFSTLFLFEQKHGKTLKIYEYNWDLQQR
eukprot:TRINITY_DN1889_c2_g1_i3.p3 TRINITY_DN1889_c2_g1~~TRINITY_DN1889_c2_g1_i3.p3  ORF type:complete len:122 (+),score=2.34 TRINITY_DN1889_c2_g1_i3:329-694(+)